MLKVLKAGGALPSAAALAVLAVLAALALASPPALRAQEVRADLGEFKVSGGTVTRDGEPVGNAEVHPLEAGDLRAWSGLDDLATGGRPGLYLFGEDGVCVGYLPLEDAAELQDMIFSGDGRHFVMVTGSGARDDVSFAFYRREGLEKLGDAVGVRHEIRWAGDGRLVYTRIDDIREGGAFPGLGYGLRLSVAMFDADSPGETVLLQSDDTRDYRLAGLVPGRDAAVATELSVGSPRDWGEADRIVSRTVEVAIPDPE
ncbi:MAG: hypothetical protein LBG06_10075 [Deltaproteobacteria bacterium]|jgi:hypothetical protein|nr:hypothetical protein [Deltaproteobacteria bacterium]